MSSKENTVGVADNASSVLENVAQEAELDTSGVALNGSVTEEQYLGGEVSSDIVKQMRKDPTAIKKLFKEGKYPYTDRIARRTYNAEKKKLQIELLKVQNWVKLTGQKIDYYNLTICPQFRNRIQ